MDAATGKLISAMSNHSAIISTVLFTPDDRTIICACFDGTTTLWDYTKNVEDTAFAVPGERLLTIALSPGTLYTSGFRGDLIPFSRFPV